MWPFGPHYPKFCKHRITKQPYRWPGMRDQGSYHFVCSLCQQSWLSAEGVSDRCPGLPVYDVWELDESKKKPSYLITAKELEVLGFRKPNNPPLGYLKESLYPYGTKWTPLYDRRSVRQEAVPKL